MNIIKMLLGIKPSPYKSPEELGIHPGWVRYKIYKHTIAGKTVEQIYYELKEEMGWEDRQKSLRVHYIEYFREKMKREVS